MTRDGYAVQILQRAELLQQVRSFFGSRGFIELDTPILQPALVPELHVHSFSLCGEIPSRRYLLPSPELAMKRQLCLLHAAGQPRSIFQLAHCFRFEEQEDVLHSWEFLMLEFYALDTAVVTLLALVHELLALLGPQLPPHVQTCISQKPQILSCDELCRRACGLSFDFYWGKGLNGMRELYCKALNREAPGSLNLDDLFHLFLVEVLEPYIFAYLPYCALYPYPDVTPLPAKSYPPSMKKHKGLWVQRWELYLCGVELANACEEENRADELRHYCERFQRELRNTGRQAELQSFDLAALDLWQELPDCSGAALGLDRLLAL